MFGGYHPPTGLDVEQSTAGFGSALRVIFIPSIAAQTPEKSRGESLVQILFEGFDPGSERTLAAWIRHASRANPRKGGSGERGSKAWVTYPGDWDSPSREGVIPGDVSGRHRSATK